MWGIARRQAAMFLRRRGPAALVLPAVVEADGRHVGDPTEAVLSRAQIAEAVAALGPERPGPRDVAAVVCRGPVGGRGGRLMGVPEGTVKSRAHRARRMLRAALDDRLAVEGGP